MRLGEEFAGVAGGGGAESAGEVISGEEEDIRGEVEGGVEEGVEADEAAEANGEGEGRMQAAQGGNGERAEQDPERPVACKVRDVVDGVGVEGEGAVMKDVKEPEERGEQEQMQEGFGGEDGLLGDGPGGLFGARAREWASCRLCGLRER